MERNPGKRQLDPLREAIAAFTLPDLPAFESLMIAPDRWDPLVPPVPLRLADSTARDVIFKDRSSYVALASAADRNGQVASVRCMLEALSGVRCPYCWRFVAQATRARVGAIAVCGKAPLGGPSERRPPIQLTLPKGSRDV